MGKARKPSNSEVDITSPPSMKKRVEILTWRITSPGTSAPKPVVAHPENAIAPEIRPRNMLTKPAVLPISRTAELRKRSSRGCPRSSPSRAPNSRIAMPIDKKIPPRTTPASANNRVWRSNTTPPTRMGPCSNISQITRLTRARTAPGTINNQRGLNSSIKRRCNQPSRQGRRWGGRERPSLDKVVDTSL